MPQIPNRVEANLVPKTAVNVPNETSFWTEASWASVFMRWIERKSPACRRFWPTKVSFATRRSVPVARLVAIRGMIEGRRLKLEELGEAKEFFQRKLNEYVMGRDRPWRGGSADPALCQYELVLRLPFVTELHSTNGWSRQTAKVVRG